MADVRLTLLYSDDRDADVSLYPDGTTPALRDVRVWWLRIAEPADPLHGLVARPNTPAGGEGR